MTVADGLQTWLGAMDEAEKDRIDPALLSAIEGLARAIDADPGNAALWREYRQLYETVRAAAAGGTDDDTAQFRITVQTPRGRTAVVDAEEP